MGDAEQAGILEWRRLSKHADITINSPAAYKLLGIQLVITVVVALLLMLYSGVGPACSALLGGLTYILPNAWFTRYAFRGNEQESPHIIVRWFYMGELGKFVLTAVMFVLCFVLVKSLQVMVLFMMYIAMIIINLAGLTLFRINKQENSG